jgi:hypothetical protein
MLNRQSKILLFLCAFFLKGQVSAMDFRISGNQLLMQGPVRDGDLAKLKNSFSENPAIDTIILRNSFGGDAWTGYRIGEFLREKRVTTVVSGWCVSACSRMFLGGVKRLFSNDYPATSTYIGFHGHYRNDRSLDSASVVRMRLKDWTLRFAGPGLPEEMVNAWINLPINTQTVNFYPPFLTNQYAYSVFECPAHQATPEACKPLSGDAVSLGIVTDGTLFESLDEMNPKATAMARAALYPASGFAVVEDLSRLPLDTDAGIDNYKRYLLAPSPKAFVVAASRKNWAWMSGGPVEPVDVAMSRCQERASQPCLLYAVDSVVVFRP